MVAWSGLQLRVRLIELGDVLFLVFKLLRGDLFEKKNELTTFVIPILMTVRDYIVIVCDCNYGRSSTYAAARFNQFWSFSSCTNGTKYLQNNRDKHLN